MPDPTILVLGAGGHAKVVADLARVLGLEIVGFLEESTERDGQPFFGARIIGWERYLADPTHWAAARVALAVGDNLARARLHGCLVGHGRVVATLVHPTAVVSPSAVLGAGTVVFATAVVNAEARVGLGAIVNTGAIAEHDTVIGDFAHLSPGVVLGGGARVGARAHLGLGAVVLPRVEIGDDVRVGAGAVVRSAVAPGLTVVGVPARPLR